jgi:hypothetical protein
MVRIPEGKKISIKKSPAVFGQKTAGVFGKSNRLGDLLLLSMFRITEAHPSSIKK